MEARAGAIVVAVVIALCALVTSSAMADGPVGADPSSNFTVGALPPACSGDPTGTECVDAAVGYLDQARATLGQPAYVLPADFASLAPAQQLFILTNLDRTLYGLPPIPGLTQALSADAATGVLNDTDPTPSDSTWMGYTSNWAGGFENAVLAYEAWMYDDGPGSDNLDCTSADSSGCWGHRHDILWQFDGSGSLAMGAAAGPDSSGTPGYAMLLEQQSPGVDLTYTYTWAEAVADGAGGSTGAGSGASGSSAASPDPSGPSSTGARLSRAPFVARTADATIRIERTRVRGHEVSFTIIAPHGPLLRCSVVGRSVHGRRIRRSKRCGRVTSFDLLPSGRYRVQVVSALGSAELRVRIR